MPCPIARALERVGEWWSILILRDAVLGATRFEQFQKSLPIAPGSLTRRLNALVEAGLLERHRYTERPPRDEYRLTARGNDFRPVLWSLLAWGSRHFASNGSGVALADKAVGADPVARASRLPMTEAVLHPAPDPAAGPAIRQRQIGRSRSTTKAITPRRVRQVQGVPDVQLRSDKDDRGGSADDALAAGPQPPVAEAAGDGRRGARGSGRSSLVRQ